MSDILARLAVRRAHVLIAEVSGQWATRAALEHRVRERGWQIALSPADADVLAVCGAPGPEMAGAVDRIWEQLPGPRARVDVGDADAVDSALDRAAAELLDVGWQRNDARTRAQAPEIMRASTDMAPAGTALAQGGDDRDGLEMDVLHVRLGPVLAHWPGGLVLRCALQGDVIAEAQAWIVDSALDRRTPADGARFDAARQCDHIADLLALAGWSRAAATAWHARDLLRSEPRTEAANTLLRQLHSTVRRSVVLRWSLRDLAPLTIEQLRRHQLPEALAGDTYDRLLTRVGHVVSDPLSTNVFQATTVVDALPELVTGLDVATARLVIAGLGVETAPVEQTVGHD